MSLTFTLSGNSSVLSVNHFPAIDLNDDDYELGLANFETYHTISNVNSLNNKFYFDKNDKEITIPKGTYELDAINEYLKRTLLQRAERLKNTNNNDVHEKDFDDEYPIIVRANHNTLKSEIICAYRINFTKPNNIIAGIIAGILIESYFATSKMVRI